MAGIPEFHKPGFRYAARLKAVAPERLTRDRPPSGPVRVRENNSPFKKA